MQRINRHGQAIGDPVPGWRAPGHPPKQSICGTYCRLEPLDPARHAEELFGANAADPGGKNWTYLPYGPFPDPDEYREWLDSVAAGDDPQFYAIIDQRDGQAAGLASYLRITPATGSIEVGHLHFSERLKHTAAATEAMYLMMAHAFDLGYRRYEWKCDALNAGSCRAAERLGLSYEGTFRQHTVYKGRNRDTAWFAAVDADWPALREAFVGWLEPGNFDPDGIQRRSLGEFTRPLLASSQGHATRTATD